MDFSEKFTPIFKQYMLPISLGGVGIVLLLYGLIQSVVPKTEKKDISFEPASKTSATAEKIKLDEITVDIEGAVLRPGVYKLPKDARVHDALIKAGGMSGKADRVQVAKALNLASKIIDGGKIYIPFEGESVSLSQTGGGGMSSVAGDSVSGLININSASATELDTLPGVGPATSEKIISNRPYEKIEDLITKKAVGQSVFDKIKDKIAVY